MFSYHTHCVFVLLTGCYLVVLFFQMVAIIAWTNVLLKYNWIFFKRDVLSFKVIGDSR